MKNKLIQLLELCIEKGLDFEANNNTVAASRWVADDVWLLRERIWISAHDEERNLKQLNDLIEKVKNYKK